ncbi:methyl-accepting chemotaxis protein [Patulibacter sp. SYSU D01012]|uniref:methyl-accepting chemotaxis protein n=1 Tax=Patulibacter sp. SYSU D01012 TaxID=2817381 RepID=UPI001B314254
MKTKILALAGGLVAALAILALIGISSLGKVNDLAQKSYNTTTKPLAQLGEARARANETRALLNNHFLTTDAAAKRDAEAKIAANDAIIARNLAAVRATLQTAKGRGMLGTIASELAAYDAQRDRLIRSSRAASGLPPAQAGQIQARLNADNVRSARPIFLRASQAFTDLFTQKVAMGQEQNDEITSVYESRRTLSFALLALALVAGGAGAWIIASRITGGVVQMMRAAQGIARGDVDQDVDIRSKDEVGRTGAAFGEMIAYLRETADAAGNVGRGDLTVTLEPRSDKDALRLAFGGMTTSLRGVVDELRASANTVSSASQQLSSTSEETSRAVAEIAEAISDVAAGAEDQVRQIGEAEEAIREAAASAEASAESAREAVVVATGAEEVTAEGTRAVAEATEAMEAVRANSAEAASAITELAEKSRRIADFIATITGIAEQTNLLALNAAIEAARAGEEGRGFAVVAEEVRKLAEESADAAGTIGGLVDEIQREMQRAVEVVQSGADRTVAGSETVGRARQAFARIEAAVGDLSSRSAGFATAADEIRAATERVGEGIGTVVRVAESSSASAEQVSASTQQTSASTQEISASAQELSATAQTLEGLVGRFETA